MVPSRADILENRSAHRLKNGISSNFKIVNALHGQPLSNIKQYLLDHNVALQLRLNYFCIMLFGIPVISISKIHPLEMYRNKNEIDDIVG